MSLDPADMSVCATSVHWRASSVPVKLAGLPDILVILDMANPKYAASDKPVPVAELVATLSDGTKVKRRIPRMRACNEKDAKGKLCAGHLKRWYFFGDEVKRKWGADAEIYRCEHCKTLYLPSSEESSINVAGPGQTSQFGLTIPGKER